MKKWIAMIFMVALCLGMAACAAQPETTNTPVVTDLQGQKLELGSQMPNVEIADALGNRYTLYDLLEEKKLVMLNFWFINCPYCVMEFPAIQGAYEQMGEDVAILAITPYDTQSEIVSFANEYSLTFPMCQDALGLSEAFGVTGYPTTVIVDRNGVVCVIHPGAMPYEEIFVKIFSHFTAEDYETELFDSFVDLLTE